MSMMNNTDFFLNFQQFGELKLQARAGTDDAARAVAQQFEGLFVQQMLAAMRAAAQVDGGEDSSYLNFYQEIYDKQLAQTIAGRDQLGVARMVMRQMPGVVTAPDTTPAAASLQPPSVTAAAKPVTREISAAPPVENGIFKAPPPTRPESRVVLHRVLDHDFAEVNLNLQANARWQSADRFVADLLPDARTAARQLGVSAELLIAQAALETGWGKRAMLHADGRNGFNLFGIKAGAEWRGDTMRKASLEYHDGLLQSETSRFRAYSSPAQSLADYAEFIQSSPRYAPVVESAANDQEYIRGIHAAGYATDPDYADKVLGILHGNLLRDTLASLDAGVIDHA